MLTLKRRAGIPIQIVFSTTIFISMLILAGILTAGSYFYARSSLIAQAGHSAKQASFILEQKIEQVARTATLSLEMLEYDVITRYRSQQQRLTRLPMLAHILNANPVLSAAYIGYQDGDFFLLRALRNPQTKQHLSAPPNAAYLMQSIERNTEGAMTLDHWEFFDASLTSLGTLATPDNDHFDPRERPWYQSAQQQTGVIQTHPYAFYTTGHIGTSFAIYNGKQAVVGVDAAIDDLSDYMQSLINHEGAQIALINESQALMGIGDPHVTLVEETALARPRLKHLSELHNSALNALLEISDAASPKLQAFTADEQSWYGLHLKIDSFAGQRWTLLYAIPTQQLLTPIQTNLIRQLLLALSVIGILIFLGILAGRAIAKPLRTLSREVGALTSFNFNRTIEVSSSIKEINELSSLTDQMAATIYSFQAITHELAHDPDLNSMLQKVTKHLIDLTSARAGAVYLYNDEPRQMELATQSNIQLEPIIQCSGNDWDALEKDIQKALNSQQQQLYLTPLIDRDETILGVLMLQLPKSNANVSDSFHQFIKEVSGAAATAISTQRQFESQQALLDGIIRLLADAIDAKSPYTSAHCERVPKLAEMIVQAAIKNQQGEWASFSMDATKLREFRIAAWLHDCGKITSPVHVVDKATKLETIYNRIHEIRTRFEVLWRDAEITYLEGRLQGQPEDQLEHAKQQTQQQLQEDFAFLARLNIGAESTSADDLERLEQVAKIPWRRHFSRRIGLSQDEQQLLPDTPEVLPCEDYLLDDKPEHIEEWGAHRPPVEPDAADNQWGFNMTLPKRAFNKGERHNLRVSRGTLTEEERFIIKDHMVQTYKMLSSLPFPKELSNIPDIASNHHETLDGTGYPRGLNREQLSMPDRMLAVADVFEALTARDRPYKTGKTLSESLKILAFMVKRNHLDGTVFRLFIEHKVYQDYAQNYLNPEQIDAVDTQQLLRWAGLDTTGG